MDRPAPRLGTENGTFLRRVGAFLLDAVVLGFTFGTLSALIAAAAFVVAPDPTGSVAVNTAVLLLQVLTVAVGFGYFVYTEGRYGQTLGKRALGIVVVSEDGEPIDSGDALVRNVLRIVDALPGMFLLGAVLILLTERGQRVGDLAAETVVVETE